MRLIPAHAGKTFSRYVAAWSRRAHPRSRGETPGHLVRPVRMLGSSPLTRGKLQAVWTGIQTTGLIPAHAGKTPEMVRGQDRPPAHPRSRGEYSRSMIPATSCGGSSPLTRGKRRRRSWPSRLPGLIPAHAGKTDPGNLPHPRVGAHPRSRGENGIEDATAKLRAGSSPLTRGKPVRTGHVRPSTGLIPAHAGKTLPDLRFYCADRSDLGKP